MAHFFLLIEKELLHRMILLYCLKKKVIIKKDNFFQKDETIYPIYEFDYSKPELEKLEMNLNILKVFD